MKKKIIALTSLIVIFIAVNIFLIYKNNSKVARVTYVSKWETLKKQDLKNTLQTAGVVTPDEEKYVYFNQNGMSFGQFFIKEGDKVDTGTPLYSYTYTDSQQAVKELEAEKNQYESDLTAVQRTISSLTDLLRKAETNATTKSPSGTITTNETVRATTYQLEKELLDKQQEQERLRNEIDKCYDLILAYQDRQEPITVNSEVEGTVKQIKQDLKNPLITVISDTPAVEARLGEDQIKDVETGMKAFVYTKGGGKPLKANVASIAKYPEEKPSLGKKSQYPLVVTLKDDSGKLAFGAHVNLSIVTEEANKVIAIPTASVQKTGKKRFVYIVNKNGVIEKSAVKLGMTMDELTEVKTGLKKGQIVISKADMSTLQNKGSIRTAIVRSDLHPRMLKEQRKRLIAKYMGIGLLR